MRMELHVLTAMEIMIATVLNTGWAKTVIQVL